MLRSTFTAFAAAFLLCWSASLAIPPDVPQVVVSAPKKPKVSKRNTYTQTLITAYNTATSLGVPPLIVQGILLQESTAGTAKSLVNGKNYGVMQVSVEAARSVFNRYPRVASKYLGSTRASYDRVRDLLLRNHEASIVIACLHLTIYKNILHDWRSAVAAYNMGIGNALKSTTLEDNSYANSVYNYKHTVLASFNNKHNRYLNKR